MLNPIRTTDFDAIRLKLASSGEILSWSHGEVVRPETINYRTQKPEKDGLFCEKIFGPSKDWECYCGKYKKIRYKGIICDKCGVEVTRSIVRRERMGHIKLESSCSHIWFVRGLSSKIGVILDLSMQALEKVIYFANFIIVDVNEDLRKATLEQITQEYESKKKSINDDFNNQIKNDVRGDVLDDDQKLKRLEEIKDKKQLKLKEIFDQSKKDLKDLRPLEIISEGVYQDLSYKYAHIFEVSIGAEAIKKLLERIDLQKTIEKLEQDFVDAIPSKKDKINKRLKILKSFQVNKIKPEWMILDVIPVIPPDLRPMVALDGGRYAASDLNDLYRRVINRNNRLKQLNELRAPEVICRNEKRMLQEAVDALLDNSARNSKTVTASTGQKRQLKSLADSLKGKQGRFRQNLLGKRTDYSGRSVIVVNPKLNLQQCGLPKIMALELFKPFVISELIKREIVYNVRSASRFIDTGDDVVWEILEKIVNKSYVLLNRAPTLHRLGIQAFRPILIEGKAIQIHPLVCTAFNADFDGDQMAVHVPLTKEAKKEAEELMLASHNLLKPAIGEPVVAPGQDIVWGAYYITNVIKKDIKDEELRAFSSSKEAIFVYESGNLKLHQEIILKISKNERIRTTVGRAIFNEILPEKLKFINDVVGKNKLKSLIKDCLFFYGEEMTCKLVDELKNCSFKFITRSGLSWSINDLPDLEDNNILIDNANKKVEIIQEQFNEGLLTENERYSKVIELWTNTKEKIGEICKKGLPANGPIYSMIDSGARGSWAQNVQILGMKGLVTSPSGAIIELPIRGNFKKGFGVLEYFISTHGVRKGLSDTALRTANAGYLTRRLVDVAQDVIVTSEDCGTSDGFLVSKEEIEVTGEDFLKTITGRYLAEDLKNSKGKVLFSKGELLTEDKIDIISKENIVEANIRSVLNCALSRGVCAKCYGYDLAYNKLVKLGTAVGIIAAQSIGEPGTQLTMRTFHTGGVAGQDDITQGLPRVEEIFENRTPKKKAVLADEDGRIKIENIEKTIEDASGKKIIVNDSSNQLLKLYYQGQNSVKYLFSELVTKIKLEGEKVKEKDIKLNIKNDEEVNKGDVLFSLSGKKVIASENGVVKVKDKYVKIIYNTEKVKEFIIPKGTGLFVKDGDKVEKGKQLTEGSVSIRELYKLNGKLESQKYIIKEIQYVYSSQGQPLNSKHVEIIVRQMFSRHLILDEGDTNLLSGETVEEDILYRANKNVDKKAKTERLLLGITKASLTTDSFLSAASFQETASVLINAAISGKIDYLKGLKENVIIGRLIPAGTGYKKNS